MRIMIVASNATLNDIDLIGTKIVCSSSSTIALTLPASVTGKNEADSEIDNIGTGNVTCAGKTISPGSHAHIVHTGSTWDVVVGGSVETDPIFVASQAYGITAQNKTDWGTAYSHSQTAHAPSDAQKNSDITKAEIEAKLTGTISTHSHAGSAGDASSLNGITAPSPVSGDDQKYLKYNHATGAYIMGSPDGGGTTTESDWGQL